MNPTCRPIRWALSFLLPLVCLSAQSTSTGTVSGQVTDRQTAVIVGAEVLLRDLSTNTTQKTQTNEVGRYIFLNVAPGTYDLTVSKSGFSQAKLSGQAVQV